MRSAISSLVIFCSKPSGISDLPVLVRLVDVRAENRAGFVLLPHERNTGGRLGREYAGGHSAIVVDANVILIFRRHIAVGIQHLHQEGIAVAEAGGSQVRPDRVADVADLVADHALAAEDGLSAHWRSAWALTSQRTRQLRRRANHWHCAKSFLASDRTTESGCSIKNDCCVVSRWASENVPG